MLAILAITGSSIADGTFNAIVLEEGTGLYFADSDLTPEEIKIVEGAG